MKSMLAETPILLADSPAELSMWRNMLMLGDGFNEITDIEAMCGRHPSLVLLAGTTRCHVRKIAWQQQYHPETVVIFVRPPTPTEGALLGEIEARDCGIEVLDCDEVRERVSRATHSGAGLHSDLGVSRTILAPAISEPDMYPVLPDYAVVRKIAKGGFGTIYLVRDRAGDLLAAKYIPRSRRSSIEFDAVALYKNFSLSHRDHLAPILHLGDTQDGGIYIIMELADDQLNGRTINPARYEPDTLANRLNRGSLNSRDTQNDITRLLEQVSLLHRHGLVHRDVKPANVIYIRTRPFLIDFSLLGFITSDLQRVGTPPFIPPEGHGMPSGDVFSLGQMLVEMIHGKKECPGCASPLCVIARRACDPNPDRRFQNAAAMLEVLKHVRRKK
jgi:hypothetical protein